MAAATVAAVAAAAATVAEGTNAWLPLRQQSAGSSGLALAVPLSFATMIDFHACLDKPPLVHPPLQRSRLLRHCPLPTAACPLAMQTAVVPFNEFAFNQIGSANIKSHP